MWSQFVRTDSMTKGEHAWERVKTSETAFDIVERVRELDGARLTTLARELDLAKSTVHRHVGTLERRGYLVCTDGVYDLGMRFLKLGTAVQRRSEGYVLAEEKVEELAGETGERAQFLVEENGYAVYVHVARGEHAVRTDPGPGSRIPIHSAAAGKAILASIPWARVEEIIDQRGLVDQTSATITDPDVLRSELESVRQRGYAFNDEESLDGLLAIGAPVETLDGGALGALSISGPTHRMRGKIDDRLDELLLGMTNELELNIKYA